MDKLFVCLHLVSLACFGPLTVKGGLGVCDLIRTNGLDSITDGLTVKLDLLQLD